MIHYAVRCTAAHEFEGWFADSESFDAQVAAALVECPCCGSTDVARALMAPAIARRTQAPVTPQTRKPPAQLQAALQGLREAVERHCDYVGDAFADQALLMHQGELEYRAIYGESTEEEAEKLRQEGVPVGRIPWVRRADS